jgi:glutamine amidotransferase
MESTVAKPEIEVSIAELPMVAIVDYGMGNLYSVRLACEAAGMHAVATESPGDVLSADAVILPGVGSFGHAMDALGELGLTDALREVAERGTMLVGICLGHQLLMDESYEFGVHRGLGLIAGDVAPFVYPEESGRVLKVPHVGWNRVCFPHVGGMVRDWSDTPLKSVENETRMYFVHSLYARPSDPSVVLATSRYGQYEFCSAMAKGNIFSFQFHPERSGPAGIRVYEAIALMLGAREQRGHL